jgi:hypothetical protein
MLPVHAYAGQSKTAVSEVLQKKRAEKERSLMLYQDEAVFQPANVPIITEDQQPT